MAEELNLNEYLSLRVNYHFPCVSHCSQLKRLLRLPEFLPISHQNFHIKLFPATFLLLRRFSFLNSGLCFSKPIRTRPSCCSSEHWSSFFSEYEMNLPKFSEQDVRAFRFRMKTEEINNPWRLSSLMFLFILSIGPVVDGDLLDTDREVLLDLKSSLEKQNPVNQGRYSTWNLENSNPCSWQGIICNFNNSRVTGIDLSDELISGRLYGNFSRLTELSYLDLSANTLHESIPDDLNSCISLRYLNLSHNILQGDLNLSNLINLETLDLSVNRIVGDLESNFPAMCEKLVVANLSSNNFTGRIDKCFETCWNLKYLDLSSNRLTGDLWVGMEKLWEISFSKNNLTGEVSPLLFTENCSLNVIDLSENNFRGEFPGEISNCQNLTSLIIWGNNFTGEIPTEIGWISSIEALYLGNNNFSREIPESLLGLYKLVFLDLSKNNFGGEIQDIFGKFRQVKFLLLHGNSYTGGIYKSGILNLPNISRLDLSYNEFSGPLPVEISQMKSLKILILAHNQFAGNIPPEIGNLQNLQALDLSFNKLNGSIPSNLGNLKSLLWLMLANNSLTGRIPSELGNCSSLLWLNLANNQLSGEIPSELTNIGLNATVTFEENRRNEHFTAGSGECLAMKRWIPANYPPFSFVYTLLTRKSCRNTWDRLLKGYGLFPMCSPGSSTRTFQISGYVQLTGNQISGELPSGIGKMHNFSMLHLGSNEFSGRLPPQIGELPLVVLNVSDNKFSGEIPSEIGNIICLQNLDLSYNNFSGRFPKSLSKLNELSKFNISYNPLISGEIPATGQFATFEKESFLGDPLLSLPDFFNITPPRKPNEDFEKLSKDSSRMTKIWALSFLALVVMIVALITVTVCLLVKSPSENRKSHESKYGKHPKEFAASSQYSSPWLSDTVKVIQLDKTSFTHSDILKATDNFSEKKVIGKGGFGTVYRGVLRDGRQVAVKKLQREGTEGEREFQAEMKVLTGNGFDWPHPNLVTLYGWCLDGSEKILVYEFMEGGSLEDLISDRRRLTWRKRLDIAIDVARALVFLHHECFPPIVHRDVKASNVMLDKDGTARVTDFGLARMVEFGDSHVSTMVAGTVGYIAPEYGQTWKATTKGDVYSFGVLAMELATARRAVDGGEECLVEWARRVMGNVEREGVTGAVKPVVHFGSGIADKADEMGELLRIGVECTAETPQLRPNMKEVLAMLIKVAFL